MGPHAMLIRLVAAIALLSVAAPAGAQTELTGTWTPRNHEDALERGGGPYAVDYTGLPINAEGRAKALSYSPSQLSMIERQCGMWPPFYLLMGPFGMKIWNETDPVSGTTIALKIVCSALSSHAPILSARVVPLTGSVSFQIFIPNGPIRR